MTEFQELTQDAPNFVSMERGELVAYAYGMFAAGTKADAENAKLRELVRELWAYAEQELLCDENCPYGDTCDWMEPTAVCVFRRRMRELGVEVTS